VLLFQLKSGLAKTTTTLCVGSWDMVVCVLVQLRQERTVSVSSLSWVAQLQCKSNAYFSRNVRSYCQSGLPIYAYGFCVPAYWHVAPGWGVGLAAIL